MSEARRSDLFSAWLDGRLSVEESATLDRELRGSREARDEFRTWAMLDNLMAEQAAATAFSEPPLPVAVAAEPSVWRRPFGTAYPLSAAVAGLLVGVLGTGLAFGFVMSRPPEPMHRQVVLDEGFESGPSPRSDGIPTMAGIWSGDFSRVVTAEQGVHPRYGDHMLRLLRADYQGKPKRISCSADLWRLVDLRGRFASSPRGTVTARVSASFNAADFPADVSFRTSESLFALDAATAERLTPDDIATLYESSLAMSHESSIPLDRDPRSWQSEHCELILPPATAFLLVRVGVAYETVGENREDFSGHYLDDVKLVLGVRGPATP